jgi:hypothetical protein
MVDIESIPIDRYVCDSCNDPLTPDNRTFVVIVSFCVRYEHGLYCPQCAAKLVGYRQKAHEKPESPLRVYLLGEVIDDLSRELCISSFEVFDPEEHR